jgi:ATP-dependent helicase/DNAse subunit B
MPEQQILSASKIKTFESCSWKYWCNYHLKLLQENNDGARRGTVCHLIFELLVDSRHKKHFDLILLSKSLSSSEPVSRLVRKALKREGGYSEENYLLCEEMIVVGLGNDFYGKKGVVTSPEKEFLLESEKPKYKIRGFIDKPIEYEKKLKIVDYKSSKNKFNNKELKSNVQAMAYTLASKKLWPKLKNVIVEFLFLRFPKSPSQQIRFTKEQLSGFEYYLEHIYKIINNFTESNAKSNFASSHPMPKRDEGFCGPLNCGFAKHKGQLKKNGELMWHCPFKFDFNYYSLVDKDGKLLKNSFNKESLDDTKGEIQLKAYKGCPAHTYDDDFDFLHD